MSSTELMMSNAVEIATSAATVAQPISLFHVQTPAVNIVSFLSVGWGLMADIGETLLLSLFKNACQAIYFKDHDTFLLFLNFPSFRY